MVRPRSRPQEHFHLSEPRQARLLHPRHDLAVVGPRRRHDLLYRLYR